MSLFNVFDTYAKLSLDTKDYDQKLNDSSEKAHSFASKLGSGLKTAASVVATATAAAATAVSVLIKGAIENYAEYEQLVGGVETLFKSSADTVIEYAANAYKTAGLSANEYMNTVTSFSASLLQSLGGDTAQAAEYANTAITDMSDNANKMGTSIESIQAAYQGFAKQNYTMLDNLKLGYGGTQSEMERLVKHAESLNSTFRATRDEDGKLVLSFAEIVEAIHIVQTEMGISGLTAEEAAEAVRNGVMTEEEAFEAMGTTAKEASTTIQGSLSSMKSAWSNLLTGIADENADFDKLINNFVDSVSTVGDNIIPRIMQALKGVGKLVEGLAPVLTSAIPALITDVVPALMSSAMSLVSTLGQAILDNLPTLLEVAIELILTLANGISSSLPTLIPSIVQVILQIVQTLIDNAPLILDGALALIVGLAEGIINSIPVIIDALPAIIDGILNFISEAVPMIIDAGIELLTALVEALPTIIDSIVKALPKIIDSIVKFLTESLPKIVEAGVKLLTALIKNLPTIINTIVKALPQIITAILNAITENLPLIINAGIQLFTSLIQALPQIITTIVAVLPQIIESIINAIMDCLPQIVEAGITLFVALIKAYPQIIATIVSIIPQIISSIVSAFGERIGDLKDVGENLLKAIGEGLTNALGWLKDKVFGIAEGVVGWFKGIFGIASPSKVFMGIGDNLALGLGEGYADTMEQVSRDMLKIGQEAIPTLSVPPINATATANNGYSDYGTGGYGFGDIIINIDGSGLTVDEIAEQLGLAVRREIRRTGAYA